MALTAQPNNVQSIEPVITVPVMGMSASRRETSLAEFAPDYLADLYSVVDGISCSHPLFMKRVSMGLLSPFSLGDPALRTAVISPASFFTHVTGDKGPIGFARLAKLGAFTACSVPAIVACAIGMELIKLLWNLTDIARFHSDILAECEAF